MKRTRILGILLSAVVLCVSLGLAELWLRMEYRRYSWKPPVASDYQSYPYTDPEQHARSAREIARMSYDPFLGYIPTPNVSGDGYRTNGQHLRYEEELGTPKPQGEIRIMVTGGSTAWGAGVRQDQTYAHVLEQRFAHLPELNGSRVRVIPAGVGAYVTTQERIFYFNHLLDHDPDILVMFTGANDVYAGYRGDHLLKNQDFMGIREALVRSPVQPVEPGIDPALASRHDPPIWANYRSKIKYRIDLALYRQRRPEPEAPEYQTLGSLRPSETLEESLRNIHAILGSARRHGIDFLFYLQPYLVVTAKPLSDWEAELIEASETETPSWPRYVRQAYPHYREALAKDAEREGYRFADGDEAIRETEEAVFVDDFHLGDRGNRLIADHLYDVLIDFVLARAAGR